MIRRTSWRYYHRDHQRIAEEVANWMAAELGWDEERRDAELLNYSNATLSIST
jgi:glycerol-3-phosphate dehydrogenase